MKRNITALLLAVLLLLCACAPEKKDESPENSHAKENDVDEIFSEVPYIGKLLSMSVIDARTGETVKVSDLDKSDEEEIIPLRYCEIDLDGDGEEECLIEYSEYGNTAVVHEYNGRLYAYMIPFRSRQTLKTDGEMMWSGGASFSGTQRIAFSEDEMLVVMVLESEFDEDVHYIDGEQVSSDKAMKAWETFEKKENAEWFSVFDIAE